MAVTGLEAVGTGESKRGLFASGLVASASFSSRSLFFVAGTEVALLPFINDSLNIAFSLSISAARFSASSIHFVSPLFFSFPSFFLHFFSSMSSCEASSSSEGDSDLGDMLDNSSSGGGGGGGSGRARLRAAAGLGFGVLGNVGGDAKSITGATGAAWRCAWLEQCGKREDSLWCTRPQRTTNVCVVNLINLGGKHGRKPANFRSVQRRKFQQLLAGDLSLDHRLAGRCLRKVGDEITQEDPFRLQLVEINCVLFSAVRKGTPKSLIWLVVCKASDDALGSVALLSFAPGSNVANKESASALSFWLEDEGAVAHKHAVLIG